MPQKSYRIRDTEKYNWSACFCRYIVSSKMYLYYSRQMLNIALKITV